MATDDVSVLLSLFVTSHALATCSGYIPIHPYQIETKDVITSKTQTLLVDASKEIVLEVNADKTEYKVMSRDQNAGQNHNIKLIINLLTGWKSSNIWEHPQAKKFHSGGNLRAE
jgi:hypothetical protein